MVRLIRSIPERMYLGGEFPGLSEALKELGLVSGGQNIVSLFGRAIAHWELLTERQPLRTEVDGQELVRRLALLTKCLRTIEYALGTHSGYPALEPDEVHYGETYNFPFLIERLAKELEKKPNTVRNPTTYLAEFRAQVRTLSWASESLGQKVRPEVSKSGPSGHVWYDWFAMAVISLCEQNGINPTISTNRTNWKRGGRFLEIAERLEKLLPPGMHSPNRQALAQKLKRSRARILPQYLSRMIRAAGAASVSRFPF